MRRRRFMDLVFSVIDLALHHSVPVLQLPEQAGETD